MNKTIKAISVLLIAAMMLFTISTTVFAVDPNGIISNMNNVNNVDTNSISTIGGQIANILSTIGIIVGVIVLLVLGIKYMMGSTSEKAEYKKTMIPYLVGIVLLLGASGIVKAIASFKLG
ncbi:unknown [Clostridium sp. CAG:567]|nr:unknown [Clostridium sp. CAG:567]